MPPKRPNPGLRARRARSQIDREISDLDRERARLVAARTALERDIPRRFSQEDVAAFLAEHPGSTYTEIAAGLGAQAKNVAMHLNRGQAAGRFRNQGGKWSLEES